MMLKEHILENYGDIRYTFGEGGSGGSIGQLAVTNAYPGSAPRSDPQRHIPGCLDDRVPRSSTAICCCATSRPSRRTCGPIPRSRPR